MTLEEIKAEVEKIEASKGDNETAHNMEDALMCAFINFVADTADAPLAEMAREVLKTADIDFARWCA